MKRRLIRSRWVAPMSGPVIDDGAVAIADGSIAAVGRYPDLAAGFAIADISDLGDAVILPGLVNAHVHLELSDCQPGQPPTDGLEGWLTRMLSRARQDVGDLERKSAEAAKAGASECLRFGVTCVGDISRLCHMTRPALRDGPLRVVSFGEVMAMARRRALVEPLLAAAADRQHESPWLRIAVSPHSPYSIEIDGYRRCVQLAMREEMPIATHLAETKSEWEFLASHSGPLKALWDAWLTWDEQVPTFRGGPIAMAREVRLLEAKALLAHVNYASDEELGVLAQGNASVVYCPRTHRYFGHPPHPFREMMQRGINVAAGTDSRASSPDLNLVDDLRLIAQIAPELPAREVWAMGTINGAKALGLDGIVGTLETGKKADLVAFAANREPLREILEGSGRPLGVWVDGARVPKGDGSVRTIAKAD